MSCALEIIWQRKETILQLEPSEQGTILNKLCSVVSEVSSFVGHPILTEQITIFNQWPNLKNLSGGLNLSRGLNMVGSTKNCIKFLKI